MDRRSPASEPRQAALGGGRHHRGHGQGVAHAPPCEELVGGRYQHRPHLPGLCEANAVAAASGSEHSYRAEDGLASRGSQASEVAHGHEEDTGGMAQAPLLASGVAAQPGCEPLGGFLEALQWHAAVSKRAGSRLPPGLRDVDVAAHAAQKDAARSSHALVCRLAGALLPRERSGIEGRCLEDQEVVARPCGMHFVHLDHARDAAGEAKDHGRHSDRAGHSNPAQGPHLAWKAAGHAVAAPCLHHLAGAIPDLEAEAGGGVAPTSLGPEPWALALTAHGFGPRQTGAPHQAPRLPRKGEARAGHLPDPAHQGVASRVADGPRGCGCTAAGLCEAPGAHWQVRAHPERGARLGATGEDVLQGNRCPRYPGWRPGDARSSPSPADQGPHRRVGVAARGRRLRRGR
mmetsp:Transcript_71325/g.152437  ORF Transcript_71325/g.152437 Transcript_71325/m.152437 type:complete len:403 (+) Transcript_71325:2176-3384(+)